ncbi:MAG TPA: hypothetical protein VH475_21210 [Tepidisphaeraceae bacterium]|jgi:hypothetical protein
MPETALSKPAAVKLNGSEFQRLVLMIDEMARLHVAGMEELCRAAAEGSVSVLAAMLMLEERVTEARGRERRRHVAARKLA